MPQIETTTAVAALLWVVAVVWSARVGIALRVARRGRWRLNPEDPVGAPVDPPLVSVCIPARDEEDSIGPCLESVLAQDHRRIQVVVADDQSRDATVERARRAAAGDPRVTILSAPPPPSGWTGKSAALWAAQAQARGDWLLFLDADVRLHPRALSVALGAARRDGADMLSWIGRLEMESFWERVVLPVMGDLIARWAPVWRVNDARSGACLANGQFILMSRAAYDTIGGHRAVRSEVVEDVALCRLVKRAGRGLRYRLYRAERLMAVRMYRSLAAVWRGFAKNSFAALGASAPKAAGAVVVVLLFDVLPWGFGLAGWRTAGATWPPAALAVAATLAHRAVASRATPVPWPYVLLHPVGAMVAAGIVADSALRGLGWRRPVSWKRRAVGGMERDTRV